MNIDLLLLNKKHTDVLIEQTRNRPQEKLEFKWNDQMINFAQEGKWLLFSDKFGSNELRL